MTEDPLHQLYGRPGFMIRRAHQIAVSLFLAETQSLGITTTQYGILFLLKHQPGLDQISVAKLLGLDRSTTAMVLKKLEVGKLIERTAKVGDRRHRILRLTPAGEDMLVQLSGPVARAQDTVLSAFETEERQEFLRLLDKFTRTFNDAVRVPVGGMKSGT